MIRKAEKMTHDCRERERESQRLPAIDQLIQDGVIQAQRNGKGTFIGCSPTLLASDYKQVPLVLERVDECMNTEREQRPQGLPEIEVIGMLESSGHDHTKYRVRKLTPTEYGRLQAFPMDNWKQVVSNSQAYKQFGNAVTVTLAEGIGKSIIGYLDSVLGGAAV